MSTPTTLNLDAKHPDEVITPASGRDTGGRFTKTAPDASSTPKRKPGRPKGSTNKTTAPREVGLGARIQTTLDRLAESLEGRGDHELAAVIREDSKAMAGGLVSLTGRFKPLRSPLLALLSVVEPLIAFGRVGRILIGRVAARRQRVAQEHADADYAADGPTGSWDNGPPISMPATG